MPSSVLFVFGTRPEAIKLAPLILFLKRNVPALNVRVCVTGQHRGMLDSVLGVFGIKPEHDLDVMRPAQTLQSSAARILASLEVVLSAEKPRMVIVQGDTTSTFMGALASFYSEIPVAHVEAGLRTGNLRQPFPEEANRVLTTKIATLHFAPTAGAAENLLADGVSRSQISITGNTGIDAALFIRCQLQDGLIVCPRSFQLQPGKKLITVTTHRRENIGEGVNELCRAIRILAENPDVEIIFPVHPSPGIRSTVLARLHNVPSVQLCEPLDYISFINLLALSHIVVTDSGGIQEEAPSFGKPVLVTRDSTERPEAVEAGTVRLVGCHADRIVGEVNLLLNDSREYIQRSRIHNPYGDGHASERIGEVILAYLSAQPLNVAVGIPVSP